MIMKEFIKPELIIILFEDDLATDPLVDSGGWGGDIDSGFDSEVPDC